MPESAEVMKKRAITVRLTNPVMVGNEEAEEEFFGRAGQFAQCACCGVVVNPDGGIAEDGKPDDAEQGGNRQNAENEFAYGASARDAGDEESDERRPRTPPCPV